MDAKDLSNRRLSDLTKEVDPSGKGLSSGHIANIACGGDRASPAALALIAKATDTNPSYFAEFRLWVARSRLNEHVVGIEQALDALERVRALLDLDEAAAEAERHFGSAPAATAPAPPAGRSSPPTPGADSPPPARSRRRRSSTR
jgi:transcriptional regulator with XRE-family HTH domain